MKRITLLLALVAFIACGKKPETESSPAVAAGPNGESIYTEKGCVTCHGPQGKGDGPAGTAFKPRPRNFSDAQWKNGTELATVIKTIETGIAGTGMAQYKGVLTDAEIKAVAEYVRKLGGKN